MRLIDADRLLDKRKLHLFYHLKNGDVAIPIIDVEHAPTVNAIPIPEGATNGDMIKAMFPSWKIFQISENMVCFNIPLSDGSFEHNACSTSWWNSPYKGE